MMNLWNRKWNRWTRLLYQKRMGRLVSGVSIEILDLVTDLIGLADRNGRVLYFNRAAREKLGIRDLDELKRLTISDMHPPDCAGHIHNKAIPSAISAGFWSGETILLTRHGRPLPVEIIIIPHRNRLGRIRSFMAVMRDKTGPLNDSRKPSLAHTVLDHIDEGIIVTDSELRILYANRTFCRLTGYSRDELIGATPGKFRTGWHTPDFYEEMWESIRKNGFWRGEVWDKRKNDSLVLLDLSITPVRDAAGETTHYIGKFQDATARRELENRIHAMERHDPLTGLPNRTLLLDRLNQAIRYLKQDNGKMAVMAVDIDDLMSVNDRFGFRGGDRLLVQVSRRLRQCLRASDTVARFDSDEMVLILPGIRSREDSVLLADRIMRSITGPYRIDRDEIRISCSIGISLYPDDAEDPDILIRQADSAMKAAKREGRNRIRFFHEI